MSQAFSLGQNIARILANQESMTATLNSQSNQISMLSTQLAAVDSNITDLTNSVERLSGLIDQLNASMTNAENQLGAVNRKLSTEWDEDGNVIPVERS